MIIECNKISEKKPRSDNHPDIYYQHMVHPTGEIFVYRNESSDTKLTEDVYFKSLVGMEICG